MIYVKGIGRAFNWLKSLDGFLHLNPTAGCQISTLIFDFLLWKEGLYKYPMKIILKTAKLHLSQLKTREIPLIDTPSGQELCRP
jgi:hypothetical protein